MNQAEDLAAIVTPIVNAILDSYPKFQERGLSHEDIVVRIKAILAETLYEMLEEDYRDRT